MKKRYFLYFSLLIPFLFWGLHGCIDADKKNDDLSGLTSKQEESPTSVSQQQVVGTWKALGTDMGIELYYQFDTTGLVTFCKLQNSLPRSWIQSHFANSAIAWSSQTQSQLTLLHQQLIESLNGQTTTYQSAQWPVACHPNFIGNWKSQSTTTNLSWSYQISTGGVVTFCKKRKPKCDFESPGNPQRNHSFLV